MADGATGHHGVTVQQHVEERNLAQEIATSPHLYVMERIVLEIV